MASEVIKVHLMHISMQFSDSAPAQREDTLRIFRRAKDRGVAWITGTEAGGGNEVLRGALRRIAPRYGYRVAISPGGDSWMAVSRDWLEGDFSTWWDKVIDSSAGAGQHGDRGVLGVGFDSRLGHITVLTAHYLTQGRPDGGYDPNLDENRRLAAAIGAHARKHGKGRGLVFYGGDQNIADRYDDTFLGAPLTSLWDELGKHQDTGHGSIDVIASYDLDGRVKGSYIRALDDQRFKLNTDHYLVEGGFEVGSR